MPDYYYLILGLVLMIALAALVAQRRSSKIDHMAPEHRAKENELYEALGVQEPSEEEELPKNHESKGEEVEAAFGHEAMQKELNETFGDKAPQMKPGKHKNKKRRKKRKR